MFRYPLYMAKILSILAHTQNIFSPLFYIQNFICYNKGQMIFPLSKPILTTDRKHQRFWQSNTKRQKSKRQKIQMGGEGGRERKRERERNKKIFRCPPKTCFLNSREIIINTKKLLHKYKANYFGYKNAGHAIPVSL